MAPPIPAVLQRANLGKSVSGFRPIVTLESLRALCYGDAVLKDLLDTVINSALRYAETVCRFQQLVNEQGQAFDEHGEKEAIERVRGSAHDTFITDVNVLARMMRRSHKDVSWCDSMNGERARYGRLSLTISFEYISPKTT